MGNILEFLSTHKRAGKFHQQEPRYLATKMDFKDEIEEQIIQRRERSSFLKYQARGESLEMGGEENCIKEFALAIKYITISGKQYQVKLPSVFLQLIKWTPRRKTKLSPWSFLHFETICFLTSNGTNWGVRRLIFFSPCAVHDIQDGKKHKIRFFHPLTLQMLLESEKPSIALNN